MCRIWSLVMAIGLLAMVRQARADVGAEAQWLWSSKFPRANETVRLRCDGVLRQPAERLEIRGLADDRATVVIDGDVVAQIAGTKRLTVVDMRRKWAAGNFHIEVTANNVAGAAGVWLQLDFIDANGHRQRLVTDSGWQAATHLEEIFWSSWEPATSFGLLGVAPWWRPAEQLDDYDQWKRAIGTGQANEAARINVVPGFQAELLRSSQPGEGSWISLTFDAKGRLIIGREGAGILRMSFPDSLARSPLLPGERVKEKGRQSRPAEESSDGADIQVELINDQLQECRGLLWAFDSLYANANNSKGLYRLRDTDGDDKFDDVKLLKATGGGVGHGRNALALGPDNLIYVIHGNNVLLPEGYDAATERSPLQFIAEDRLRPAFWDRFMFDAAVKVPAGHVARTNAEGTLWQVMAGGFRNPYGLDFNADGELFTFDADNEGDQGTPWYRPTRFNHVVSGGDYGFRQGSANRPGHYAEHLPSNLDMGLASPTGVKSGHRGKFPAPYDRAIFVCDWSYGRIHAIHTHSAGASFRCDADLFLEGQPLNVTDLTFGPDGAMYFVTGGRGTQSGLYRVCSSRSNPNASTNAMTISTVTHRPTSSTVNPGRGGFSELQAHELRQEIQRWHSVEGLAAVEILLQELGHRDDWQRHAVRIALEHHPSSEWLDRALSSPTKKGWATATIGALLAVARVAGSDTLLPDERRARLLHRLCERTTALPLGQLSPEQQLDALRVYAVGFARLGPPTAEVAQPVTAKLAALYPHELESHNQRLCELFAYLEWPPLVEKTIPRLEAAVVQEDKLAYLTILRNVKVGWNIELRRRYFIALQQADTFDGGNLLPIAVNGIREDALATLSADERHELGAVLEPAAQQDNISATATAQRPIVREWKLEDFDEALKSTNSPRDLARGQRLFREVLCVQCHRFGGEGRTLGPDITFVASRFGHRDLLEHLLVPSKVIDGKYRQTIVETKSGQVLVGRVIGGDDQNLLVATDPLRPTKVTKLSLDNIETRNTSPVSPMPIGLLNSLTQEEILDLLEYLRVGTRR